MRIGAPQLWLPTFSPPAGKVSAVWKHESDARHGRALRDASRLEDVCELQGPVSASFRMVLDR